MTMKTKPKTKRVTEARAVPRMGKRNLQRLDATMLFTNREVNSGRHRTIQESSRKSGRILFILDVLKESGRCQNLRRRALIATNTVDTNIRNAPTAVGFLMTLVRYIH